MQREGNGKNRGWGGGGGYPNFTAEYQKEYRKSAEGVHKSDLQGGRRSVDSESGPDHDPPIGGRGDGRN